MKKSGTDGGVSFDYQSVSLYRDNVDMRGAGLVQSLVPALQKRALSVITHPLQSNHYRDQSARSFAGIWDTAQDYIWNQGTDTLPNRAVSLESLALNKPSQISLRELEKGLLSAGVDARCMHEIIAHFAIARQFAMYGQSSDISGQSLSLKVRYANAALSKVFNHYVAHLRRCTISADGVRIDM